MKALVVATALAVGCFVLNVAPAFSQDKWGLLTPAQRRAYHACLYGAMGPRLLSGKFTGISGLHHSVSWCGFSVGWPPFH